MCFGYYWLQCDKCGSILPELLSRLVYRNILAGELSLGVKFALGILRRTVPKPFRSVCGQVLY